MVELPKRKPNRLQGYDYSKNGYYFITMCVKDRCELLWENVGARIARPSMVATNTPHLSEHGLVVDDAIKNISLHYVNVSVDKYVIMPNHLHLILQLHGDNGRAMRAPTMSNIVNQMKGYVTKCIGFSIWQRSFHDHIIRNENEYQLIWNYIDTNPSTWEDDCFYINNPIY